MSPIPKHLLGICRIGSVWWVYHVHGAVSCLLLSHRKRDVSKSWILEEEDDEQTDTWTAFKGGLASWLSNRRSSNDRKNSTATLVKPKEG